MRFLKSSINIKKTGLLFCFLLAAAFSHAQIIDSIRLALKEKPKLFFQIDSYNSIVSGTRANAFGFKTGLEYGKKIRFGIGYFWLNTDIVEPRYIPEKDDTFRTEIKSNYLTLGAEYIWVRKGPWQVSTPLHFGFGNSYRVYPFEGKDRRTDKHSVILFEPAITGHYKFVKWVGIGFGFGYRIMLKNNPEVKDKFTGPLYVLRLKIFMGEIYRSVFPKKKK